VTSRSVPQQSAQMRPWTAGQKRFSLRILQIAQLNSVSSKQSRSSHYVIPPGQRLGGGAFLLDFSTAKCLKPA
jgi:hypothetical protein